MYVQVKQAAVAKEKKIQEVELCLRNLIDCVRDNDLSLMERLLKKKAEEEVGEEQRLLDNREREVAALVACREGYFEALRILVGMEVLAFYRMF